MKVGARYDVFRGGLIGTKPVVSQMLETGTNRMEPRFLVEPMISLWLIVRESCPAKR